MLKSDLYERKNTEHIDAFADSVLASIDDTPLTIEIIVEWLKQQTELENIQVSNNEIIIPPQYTSDTDEDALDDATVIISKNSNNSFTLKYTFDDIQLHFAQFTVIATEMTTLGDLCDSWNKYTESIDSEYFD